MTSIVISCFLFSMGSKPQNAKWKYKTSAVLLALLVLYMVTASVRCAVAVIAQGGNANSVMLFSIMITYGSEFCSILRVSRGFLM